jgi:hypothetical protein
MAFLEADMYQLNAIGATLRASQAQIEQALSRAVNRVIATVKARFGKELAAEAGLKLSQFQRHRTRLGKASRKRPKAVFWAGLNSISLGHYTHMPINGGVQANIGSKGNMFLPHAFTVAKKRGNVFARNKYLPDMPAGIVPSEKQFSAMRKTSRLAYNWDGAAKADAMLAQAMQHAERRLLAEFEHELHHVIFTGKGKS